jgi:hypothetical protein
MPKKNAIFFIKRFFKRQKTGEYLFVNYCFLDS